VRAQRDETPFFIAAKYVDLPAMHLLHDKGALTTTLKDGTTPLMAVMSFDNNDRPTADAAYQEAIQLCLDSGIGINTTNNVGNTALHYAAGNEHDASVQYLVDHGADLNAKTKFNRTPLDWAEGKRPSGLYGAIGTDGEREGLPHFPTTIALLQKLMSKTSADARQ
jgi:ankyrin repeat protein